MNLDRLALAVAATGLAVLAGCGGTQPEPPTSAPAPAPATSEPATGAVAWKDMKRAARIEHMKHVVLPMMKAEFAAFEPDVFADFKCAVCHGDGAADKTYKMPNSKLPRLPSDAEGMKALAAAEPEAFKFMSETVVPKMAAALGEKPYDPATHEGFGCFRCHATKW
jgi:hypothetical protein